MHILQEIIKRRRLALVVVSALLFAIGAISMQGCGSHDASGAQASQVHFVPNSQAFWDFSKNWPTNYGPAYRDTVNAPSNFLPCTGQYALCAESGPEPLPCTVTPDGRFANCKCVVRSGLNFVQIPAILNGKVYQDTVNVCGADGAKCFAVPNKAPVCGAMQDGTLIPGADVISDFNPDAQSSLAAFITDAIDKPALTVCPKAPYAGCMTAPCKIAQSGDAECSCPIFWGIFQLAQADAKCTLGNNLVWSASYVPALDVSVQ
jgi:hypothetical protein